MEIERLCPTDVTYGIFFVYVGRLIYLFLVDNYGPGIVAQWAVVYIQNDMAVFHQEEVQKVVVDLLDGPILFGNQLVYKMWDERYKRRTVRDMKEEVVY